MKCKRNSTFLARIASSPGFNRHSALLGFSGIMVSQLIFALEASFVSTGEADVVRLPRAMTSHS